MPGEAVLPGPAEQRVCPVATLRHIIARAPDQRVIAARAMQRVVARLTVEAVTAAAPVDLVVPFCPRDGVAAAFPGQKVIRVAAKEGQRFWSRLGFRLRRGFDLCRVFGRRFDIVQHVAGRGVVALGRKRVVSLIGGVFALLSGFLHRAGHQRIRRDTRHHRAQKPQNCKHDAPTNPHTGYTALTR